MKNSHPSFLLIILTAAPFLCAPKAISQNAGASVAMNQSPTPKQLAYAAPSNDLTRLRDCAQSNYQALQFQTAAAMYKRVCETPTADANDFYWLGETYSHLHQYSSAAQMFNQALTLNPAADNVRVRLAQAFLAGKQPQQARQTCTAALATVKDDYSRRQLAVLLKVSSTPEPLPPSHAPTYSKTGHLER